MRILIVEDEPNLGRQLKSTLEQTGYAVDLAADGEEGHFLGATENYDAVILDLGLPEVDGLTVLDRWRKEGRTTPVLVLTARDSWSDKVAGLDAGADDVDSDDEGHWIYCSVESLSDVSDALEKALGESTESKLVWRPQSRTEVDLDTAQKLMRLIDMLEEDDDVQTVTHNFDIPDEVAAQLG